MRRWADTLFWFAHVAMMAACAVVPVQVAVMALGSAPSGLGAPQTGRWLALLWNTVLVAGTAVVVALPAGTPTAALVFRTNVFGRRVWAAVLLVLVCLPVYVSSTALLAVPGIPALMESRGAAGLLYGLILVPLAAIIIGSGLLNAPRACEDVARLDADPASAFWHVTLPASRWHVAAAGLLVMLIASTDTFLTDVLQVRTFAEETYTGYTLYGAAAGPLRVILPMTGLLALGLTAGWLCRPAPRRAPSQPAAILELGRLRVPLSLLLAGLGVAASWTVLAPLLRELEGWAGFAAAARTVRPELLTSCQVGLAGATLCAVLAPGLAWMVLRCSVLRWPLLIVLAILLSMPGPALGITLIGLLNRDGVLGLIYDSPAVLIVGLAARLLPVAVLLMIPAVEAIPQEVVDAARLDGAGTAALQRHVVWPLCAARIAAVWFLTLVLALGETACSVLLAPPGHTPLAVRFFTLIHYGIYREAAAVVILTLLVVLGPALLLAHMLQRRQY